MNKTTVALPGNLGEWDSYISKYQPDSSKVLDNMFTSGSKNFVTDQTGMVDKRQGGVQWNRTSFSDVAKDTYEAVFESGARHFLRVGGGNLHASTGDGLFSLITPGYSTFGNFEWATFLDRAYGCNGINAPQTYDIATSYGGVSYVFTTGKTKAMGAQAPVSAPTAGAPSAGGAVPIGSHRYKITFMYYDSEESNGSIASAVQTTTAGVQTIPLTAIPIGGYGVTARNIYRDNNDGVYLLLDTISNNTSTTYNDVLLIGATPTPMPLFNNAPPTFSKIALWQDSLFIAPTGETNLIRYSNSGEPDVYDPGNFINCQSDDVVTAIYVYNGKLYVFGLHSFGTIEGNTPDTYFYHNISNLIGCVDNRSIQVRSIVSVPTLWWLSDKGFYYSNGNTVEYGSDFIQDLVNLNLAQVNYSTNKNTQSSQADFAGDTSSPGIDITSSPGSVKTINPTHVFSTQADWLGGTVKTNIKTSNGNLLEAPTQYAPTAASGNLTGEAILSGSNLTLITHSNFTGEHRQNDDGTNPIQATGSTWWAQPIVAARSGTITSVAMRVPGVGGGASGNFRIKVWGAGSPTPGSVLFTGPTTANPANVDAVFTVSTSIAVTGGQVMWIGVDQVFSGFSPNSAVIGNPGFTFNNGSRSFLWSNNSGGSWNNDTTGRHSMSVGYDYSQAAVASVGTWTSPVYDSGAISNIPAFLTETGTYPGGTSATVTVRSSAASNMSSPNSQVISSPNGANALSLTGLEFYQITVQMNTADDRIVPILGAPSLQFNTNASWVSQPIDSTTDNTGWSTLVYTGSVPLGTSATLTVATSTLLAGPYSAFGPVGSALTQRYAKVKIDFTTTSDNVTSASIASITLNWAVTSTIISSAIDTGTLPAGFAVFQWEQVELGVGTVVAAVRTATTAIGLAAQPWTAVLNGEFPALTALQFVQWRLILSSTPDTIPEVTSVTVNWFIAAGTVGVRCASIFYNKTYSISVATIGATANNTVIQLDQFGKWRVQKDVSIGTFLSYFNTLYFTDGANGNIFNGFIAPTDNGTPIVMDVRTKAWAAVNDMFLKVPRGLKVTGINTGTTIHAYYSSDRGQTWIEMVNEGGTFGFITTTALTEFVVLFVPRAESLVSGRTLMYRITSSDVFPCSIMNMNPSFYTRRGRYLSNG